MTDQEQSTETEKDGTLGNSINPHHVTIFKNLKDTALSLTVILRAMEFPIGRLLALTPGSFLQFKSHLNEPATVIVNKKKIAEGKVIQKGKKYGIRIDNFAD